MRSACLLPVLLITAGVGYAGTNKLHGGLADYRPSGADLLESYKRADRIVREYPSHAFMVRLEPHWIDGGKRFWYLEDRADGTHRFVVVDSVSGVQSPAFDHSKLAQALGKSVDPGKLPFRTIEFVDSGKAVQFFADGQGWKFDLAGSGLTKVAISSPTRRPREAPWTQETWAAERQNVTSPDGNWTARIEGYNVYVKPKGGAEFPLSHSGAKDSYFSRVFWTPDSKRLVAVRVMPGDRKPVYLIESSPRGGGRAVLHSRLYDLPGDKVDQFDLFLLDPSEKSEKPVNAEVVDYGDMPFPRWEKDGRHFTYEKMDRGYGRWRIIEVDSETGDSKAIVDEHPSTFFDSTSAYTHYFEGSDEIIWRSERTGWGQLYLTDGHGQINPITKGEWVVRGVEKVDEKAREIVFTASGMNPGEDPYFIHYYRVNFDGTGLTSLTPAPGNHTAQFSPDGQSLMDSYSTVNMPPVHELRSVGDGHLIATVAKADISQLKKTGWCAPEPFVAKGRDGKTDIYGIVLRPSNFDPRKKYPVLEDIYAGPQDSYVPKSFAPLQWSQPMAELGFIVVQIDGMGTRNRSKAFQDVAYKNLADAGFLDRILWMKALAAKYRSVDISRVGVYGTSAGGQNSTAAVLFHPEFYKVAVSSCGCHDNRMDKIWWNEQWMGPIGPHYAEQSNITNAYRLKGKLLLMVGELDTNVPPETTYRLCDALIKANKDFSFLVLPGSDHTSGGTFGERKRRDFFVKNLLGVDPPNWNEME